MEKKPFLLNQRIVDKLDKRQSENYNNAYGYTTPPAFRAFRSFLEL